MIERRFNLKGKQRKKKLIKKIFYISLVIIFLSVLAYNANTLLNWNADNKAIGEEIKEIEDEVAVEEIYGGENINPPEEPNNDYWNYIKLPFLEVNITDLQKVNKDTVGFLNVRGTNINYPVVQTNNNDYYINHSFKKEKNEAGWIFMDYRNNASDLSENTIIYGHSRIDTTMFGTLKNILKSDWIKNKDNYVIRLSTKEENTIWQVFSVYTIKSESYYITTNFKNKSEYSKWIQTMIKRSDYKFSTTVNENDKVLTLSTCYTDNKRVVLHAKLIKKADR